jgi:hypothetical protein
VFLCDIFLYSLLTEEKLREELWLRAKTFAPWFALEKAPRLVNPLFENLRVAL